MQKLLIGTLAALALLGAGCGGSNGGGDGGGGRFDSGPTPGTDSGPGTHDSGPTGPQDAGPGVDGGCIPGVEICGDFRDENCDGREDPCGDNDHDGHNACTPMDTDLTACDCNDRDPMIYPGPPSGAPERCNMQDDDCDGTVDEAAACCTECMALGDTTRADTCIGGGPSGQCDCAGEPGIGACPAGQACCTSGCADLQTDVHNCGLCEAPLTPQADRCVGGVPRCGTGDVCACNNMCAGGTCSGTGCM